MKLLLLASTALAAATSPTTQALVERQGPVLQADIAAIVSSVLALKEAVSNFHGAQQADGLVASSQAVVGYITKATTDAKSSPPLKEAEAVDLTGPIENLVNKVNATVESLVSKKQVLAASGRGCEVLPQLQAQEAGTKALLAALTPKLPTSLQGIAPQLSAPIIASLAKGMAAFKDVQCTSATTSTTEAATSASASTSASATTAETTTTASESTAAGTATGTTSTGTTTATATATAPGNAPGTVTSVASATETESCPPPETVTETKTEPCDTETAGPTGGHGTKTTDGPGSGSQPTGGNRGNPGGSQPTAGNGEKPGSQPTGDNRGNPGSGGSGPEPTTLVPVPAGDNNNNNNNGGSSTSPAGSSPTSPVVVAGAARGQVCFLSVTFAAMVGVIGAVAL